MHQALDGLQHPLYKYEKRPSLAFIFTDFSFETAFRADLAHLAVIAVCPTSPNRPASDFGWRPDITCCGAAASPAPRCVAMCKRTPRSVKRHGRVRRRSECLVRRVPVSCACRVVTPSDVTAPRWHYVLASKEMSCRLAALRLSCKATSRKVTMSNRHHFRDFNPTLTFTRP